MKKKTSGGFPMPPRRVVPVGGDRRREQERSQREAETQVREQGHPLFENLGSRNVPRKRTGR